MKHAFILSFFFLLRFEEDKVKNYYYYALKHTIQLGGDTDTNACIVGGMIGALVGLKNIPKEMVEKVLKHDCTDAGSRSKRPEFLNTRKLAVKSI
mmetsp:Transcript_15641/g.26411  ORF Transcript_15641/g.26411 Transcript_15641/m.26411 type:complete len:95 (+) Transcript_15641:187-471(+)